MKPNLFSFATKELSQDAFLCWLISWGDVRRADLDPHLHEAGKAFLDAIFTRAGLDPLAVYELAPGSPEQQWQKTDVLVKFQNGPVLLIEDKAGSREHSGQLQRYLKACRSRFPGETIIPLYLQTDEQSGYRDIEAQGYVIYRGGDLLDLLLGYGKNVASEIYRDFTHWLEAKQADLRAFMFKRDWEGPQWKGFYSWLEAEFEGTAWAYTPNPSGGFFAFWWPGAPLDTDGNTVLYLQIQQEQLVFRLSRENGKVSLPEARRVFEFLRKKGIEKGLDVQKTRLRSGGTMAIGRVSGEYRTFLKNNKLDIVTTHQQLQKTAAFTEEAAREIRSKTIIAETMR